MSKESLRSGRTKLDDLMNDYGLMDCSMPTTKSANSVARWPKESAICQRNEVITSLYPFADPGVP